MSSILKSFRVAVRGEPAFGPGQPSALSTAPLPDPSPATPYEEGFALGRQEGLLQAQQELGALLQTAQSIVADVTAWQRQQLERELPGIVELAAAIAERIVRREVAVDHQVVIRTIEEAVRQREARGLVRIAVNPDELETVREHWENSRPGQAEVELYADPSVQPGGCLLMTESSLIDALVETQLDVIARELKAERRAATDGRT